MYVIVGLSQNGDREIIDSADTVQEAQYLTREYRLAFGPGWLINWRKRRIGDD